MSGFQYGISYVRLTCFHKDCVCKHTHPKRPAGELPNQTTPYVRHAGERPKLDNTTCRLSPFISSGWTDHRALVSSLSRRSHTEQQLCTPRLAPLPVILLRHGFLTHWNCLHCTVFPFRYTAGWRGQPRPEPSIVTNMRCDVLIHDVWFSDMGDHPCECFVKEKCKIKEPCDSYNLKGVECITPPPCGSVLPDLLTSVRHDKAVPLMWKWRGSCDLTLLNKLVLAHFLPKDNGSWALKPTGPKSLHGVFAESSSKHPPWDS